MFARSNAFKQYRGSIETILTPNFDDNMTLGSKQELSPMDTSGYAPAEAPVRQVLLHGVVTLQVLMRFAFRALKSV